MRSRVRPDGATRKSNGRERTNWSGPAFVWVGESVRPAYETGVCKQQVQKRPGGGNADRTKLGRKQNCSENSRGRRGAVRFAEEDAEAADAKWGWSKRSNERGKSTRLGRGAKMHLGVQAVSLYRYARRASSQQSARGMAKRNGKAKCGAKRCKDLPPSLSHGPGGLRQSLREVREFECWCLRRVSA